MNRSHRSFLLGVAGLTLAGAAVAGTDADVQNRLREAYRAGYRRARAQGLERIRELSDSRVRLARRLMTARRLHDALLVELEAARGELAECGQMSIPRGEMPGPGEVARLPEDLPPAGVEDGLGGDSGPGGLFGIPAGSDEAPSEERVEVEPSTGGRTPDIHIHGPIVGPPLMADPRLVEAGARGVVAGVQRDVQVAGTVAQEGLGVAGTALQQHGELLHTGVGAVGTVAGGYVDAVQGLGEDRSLLGHVGHTYSTIGGGWVQAGRDVGGQVVQGHQAVWGRAWEGAREVGSAWWDGTQHLADEVLSPFRGEPGEPASD